MIKRIAILTSGGDAPGMNNAIVSIIKYANLKNIETFVVYEGYKGLVENNIVSSEKLDLNVCTTKGGTFIYSSRFPEFTKTEIREKAVNNIKQNNIDALILLGGEGTYKGAKKLFKMGINCIFIPATIDNDVYSSATSIGFDTSLNTIVESVDKIRDTSRSHNYVSIVEIMGNKCGDLTVFSGIASNAEAIVTRENKFSINDFVQVIKKSDENNKRDIVIMVAEFLYDKVGSNSLAEIAKTLKEKTKREVRVTTLSQIQRGGTPTAMERVFATRLGIHAIDTLIQGLEGRIIANDGEKIVDYSIMDSFDNSKRSRKNLVYLINKINILK